MKKTPKHPEEMSLAELAEATKPYDAAYAFERGKPTSPAEKLEERRLRRPRNTNGRGARKISISLEQNLLRKTDSLAKKSGLNRSQLISKLVIAAVARHAV